MAARTVPGLGLRAFWPDGENAWGTFHSQDIRLLSALVNCKVIDIVDATPAAPADGDIYLFSAVHPTNPNDIAIRDNGAWVFVEPNEGFNLWVADENVKYDFDGATWAVRAGSTPRPFILGTYFVTCPPSGEVLIDLPFTVAVDFAALWAGAVGSVLVNPTASYVLDIRKGTPGAFTSVGTVTISTAGVFTFAGTADFAIGDRFRLVAPAVDASIGGLAISFKGVQL